MCSLLSSHWLPSLHYLAPFWVTAYHSWKRHLGPSLGQPQTSGWGDRGVAAISAWREESPKQRNCKYGSKPCLIFRCFFNSSFNLFHRKKFKRPKNLKKLCKYQPRTLKDCALKIPYVNKYSLTVKRVRKTLDSMWLHPKKWERTIFFWPQHSACKILVPWPRIEPWARGRESKKS